MKSVTLKKAGRYKLEVWGARGGYSGNAFASAGYNGPGMGSYEAGEKNMQKDAMLLVLVGGAGESSSRTDGSGGGGGGTFIASGSAVASASAVIIAGGGYGRYSKHFGANSPTESGSCATTTSTNNQSDSDGWCSTTAGAGFSVTQYRSFSSGWNNVITVGAQSFKQGGEGCHRTDDVTGDSQVSGGFGGGGCSCLYTGGGGGGYLGGAVTGWTGNSYSGSSYNSLTNISSACGNASMPNPRGSGNIIGNNGNGYAKITYLGT